jgi:SPX domain protein involved in polyphosphate accumulation
MKFGKHLKREGKREWEAFYVNYKSLKKSLSGAVEPFRQAVATSSSSLSSRAADQLIHQLFMTQLHAELTKVNQFYFVIEGECQRKMEAIEAQLQVSGFGFAQDLLLPIFQFVETLDHLRKYAVLNYIALVKIIKKRNKQIQDYEVLHPQEILLIQPFYCSPQLYEMIQRVCFILFSYFD